ncbi:MAG: rhomboid family intramembrane serine protease [Candidatus Methylacidiphilales bacterium]
MSYRSWPSPSGSYGPLTYLRGFPVDVTTLLVLAHIVGMMAMAMTVSLMPGGSLQSVSQFVMWFGFDPSGAFLGKPWTIMTYPFVHNIAAEHIFFAVDMLIFYWFGREVERHIGHSAFLWFYALLVVLPAMAMAVIGLLIPAPMLFGSRTLHFAVFIGFVTIYPNVQFFFGLVARWLAVGFLAIFTLKYLMTREFMMLSFLWTSTVLAWFLLKSAGVRGGFSWMESLHGWREKRHDDKIRNSQRVYDERRQQETQTVDALLEKISRQGMQSLSREERDILDRASKNLQKRKS